MTTSLQKLFKLEARAQPGGSAQKAQNTSFVPRYKAAQETASPAHFAEQKQAK
ncbi:MAG: hypothetical protein WC028_27690 [Candidatus Obscuribacterales bacterium]